MSAANVTASRLWAHSPAPGSSRWHALDDHLRSTAELARGFADPFGGGEVAYWLGRLHDIGKASCAWQDRLALVHRAGGGPVGIDHKTLGTRLAFDHGLGFFALGILGHHGGLVDRGRLTGTLKDGGSATNDADALRALPALVPDLPASLRSAVPAAWLGDPLAAEMAMRMCFSALVDADYLDTDAHFKRRPAPRLRAGADFGELARRFERARAELLAGRKWAPVDSLRERVYEGCLAKAELPPGIFRLAAPTGAGKTLAAAGFALRHAERHGLRRIIVAVPFLTITEQNAAVYRGLLDAPGEEPVVLEHHSGMELDGPGAQWARLAAENWDAPFVVTTFVRLFESLFGRRPAAMRRVHRLAGAVVVLDEVQALRHAMLAPILDGLRTLVTHFGATVLLSSATQPDFWALKEFAELPAADLVDDPAGLAGALRRVEFEWQLDPPPSLADIAGQARAEPAAMVVVNTTADAKAVFELWRQDEPTGVAWHLSTRMCPDHRRRVLETVRGKLRRGERVLLVSTQLIEAGVDLDFPVVFRAMAPADSLLQAAGRANRDGRLSHPGRVVVFAPADGGQPPSYKALVDQARVHFGPGRADPDDPVALPRYYRAVYDVLNLADQTHVGRQIQHARGNWEFQTVAEGPLVDPKAGKRDRTKAFRIIDDEGISAVTPQGAADPAERRRVEDLIGLVRSGAVPEQAHLRQLQRYTTSLHPSVLRTPGVCAVMEPILGGEVRPGALVEWRGRYDEATGIDIDPRTEDFVI
ncbi:MAG TPA: CRISPR-associated helicase Cas3' [Micromonosporaceae bacterium]|nr:CRISPR-associated helicase Cas3' [Micromonosporaceae bacterium]